MIWNKLASKYDRLWVQKHSLTPTRNKVLAHLAQLNTPNIKLLDLGCGTGQLLESLSTTHPDFILYGIDKSEEMLRIAKEKHINAIFLQADMDQNHLETKSTTTALEPGTFDRVICSHSFPYYKRKQDVLAWVASLLKEDGIAIFTQASINSGYDRIVMQLIEKTAEAADYLSTQAFRKLVEPYFEVTDMYLIRQRRYMPSIYGFVLRKKA